MRLLICLTFVMSVLSAPSIAAEISKEMANKYYNNCIAKESPQKLSKESQDLLCACTAAKMMDNMTLDDIKTMSNPQDPDGARQALNHMLVKVYAPCMEYPAKDHYFNTCLSDPKTKTISKDPTKLCGCMADKIASHLAENGEVLFEGILSRNPNMTDPMSALQGDPEFQQYIGKQVMTCVF